MSRFTLGVDPGFTGAVAILDPDGNLCDVHDMPTVPGQKGKTELNHAKLHDVMGATWNGRASIVWLELVGARPGQGVSSMLRFGKQIGAIEMSAASHKQELRFVTPSSWKGYFGLSADKGVARGLAMRRFPSHASLFERVKDDGRAEACLIALYGYEHRQ